ncbi:ABC transporter ATP-binding protein [Spirochaeta dissipatitropha]
MLSIDSLVKVYPGGVRANDGITLQIERGEVFGLLGPNGAGKTTLVSQVGGYLKPTSGRMLLDGVDLVRSPRHARSRCSIQPQGQITLGGLSPTQAVQTVGLIRGGSRSDVKKRTAHLFSELELNEWANAGGEHLSGGVKRLVTFCMAAVVPGDVVILDEPTNDVDPMRRRLLWKQIRALKDFGAAVFLITHNVHEAEAAVDRLSIIDHGKIQAIGTPRDIAGDSSLEDVYIRIAHLSMEEK